MEKMQVNRVVSLILMIFMILGSFTMPVYAAEDNTARYSKIVATANCSFAIDNNDSLWAWGSNSFGQLGDGTDNMRLYAVEIMEDVVSVATGGNHTLAIRKDGSLWAWGSNNFGQLGNGTTKSSLVPEKVMDDVVSTAAGINFSLAVTTGGAIYAWGNNTYGQLGADISNQLSPAMIIKSDVVSVFAASTHAMAIKSDNTLWSWGYNSSGQVGNNTTVTQKTPVKVMENVIHAAVGDDRSMAIDAKGSLYAWGANHYGSLGDGKTTSCMEPKLIMSDVADMSCGNMFSLIVKKDGSLLACGYNSFGQLGDGTTITRREPIKVFDNVEYAACGAMHSLVVKKDGSLWGWGNDSYGQMGDGTGTNYTLPMESLKDLDNVVEMSAGDTHTMALKNDRTLWIWGANTQGQLGDGTYKDNPKPQMILENVVDMDGGSGHTLAVQSDGKLWAWGYNAYGQIGNDSTINSKTPFNALNDVQKVACGNDHSLAIKKDGSLWGWGDNSSGQLGTNIANKSKSPIHIMDDVADVAAGYLHTVVLKTDGSLWTFGYNYSGQLGDGSKANSYEPIKIFDSNVVSISAGANRTQAVMDDGSLWIWGDNTYGQVGDGTTIERTTPVKVLDDVLFVVSGGVRTLAIKENNSLWVWGAGPAGDGKANDTKRTEPRKIMTDVASVAAGYYNTFVIKMDGSIWSWGGNHRGSQGYDETIPRELMSRGSILPYTPPEPGSFTDITSVTITGLVEPVTGAWPVGEDNLNTFDRGYCITKINWSPAVEDYFQPETKYTATIILTEQEGYQFIEEVIPSINTGQVEGPVKISTDLPHSFTFDVKFPETKAYEQETVKTPTASVVSGTSFDKELEIVLSTETDGAIIYYTTDGSNPSIGIGVKYNGAIKITKTTTINAVAVKDDINYSGTSKFTYYHTADTDSPVPGGKGVVSTSSVTENLLVLNWIEATDIVTKATDLKYYIYQKTGSMFKMINDLPTDGTLLNAGGTANIATYKVDGLSAGKTYYFIVVVEDEAGNKCAYTAINETTKVGGDIGGGDIGGGGIGGGGGGGGGIGTVSDLAIYVSGVELPYTSDEQSKVTASPTDEQTQNIIKNTTEDTIIFDFSGVDEIKTLEVELNPVLFDGSGKNVVFSFDGCSLKVPYDIFGLLRNIAKGKVVFSIKKDSVDVSITRNGKEIGLYNFVHPMIISLDFTLPKDISTHQIVMTNSDANVIPRSWYHNGKIYAKIYEAGKYDAKIVELTGFADVNGRWMSEAVSYMAERGIVKGVGDGLFAPDTNITRSQFIFMLMRLLSIEHKDDGILNQFDDVEKGVYYYDALLHAKALGLVTGAGDNTFNPDDQISRQDMFVMLYRAADILGMLPEVMTEQWVEYNDWDNVASYASDALQDLSKLNLVKGNAGNINPTGTATRAEAVQVLYNLLKIDE